jgi:hypothetical protein
MPPTAARPAASPDGEALPEEKTARVGGAQRRGQAPMTAESTRLRECHRQGAPWYLWGPYLSERQWGTVREDYSENGNAWDYFSHDQARSRTYRWGEDGLLGISDDRQRLCFALALWNGVDPILKERLFGLTNNEGNHGEDVKEYYYYLDSTPTHSYMKALYRYPQSAFPYGPLVHVNRRRTRLDPEYELIDTGAFDNNRYFDVTIQYAKAAPDDLLIVIEAVNRGPAEATLRILPTLWFRNTWSWSEGAAKPELVRAETVDGAPSVIARHSELGEYRLYCADAEDILFTENETNTRDVFGTPNRSPYVKDGIHNAVVGGDLEAVSRQGLGTKCAADYRLTLAAGEATAVRLRLRREREPSGGVAEPSSVSFGASFERLVRCRQEEADEFYTALTPGSLSADQRQVIRQAFAGMLWTKQYYCFDLHRWLEEHGATPLTASRWPKVRNGEWFHLFGDDIVSMPDKWEYPWFAAWDLAFHAASIVLVDPELAKGQLALLFGARYLHPNGQLPAYEWNFSDVSPPVHAWAVWNVYAADMAKHGGSGDVGFLRKLFPYLIGHFTWWANRKDSNGRSVFEGGFLGLDNIGLFERNVPLATGGRVEQADGIPWMAFFAHGMLRIAVELARHDSAYLELADRYFEYTLWLTLAMNRIGDPQVAMWDEEDGFFYDILRLPDGEAAPLKARSATGLLPLCAATVFDAATAERLLGNSAGRFPLAPDPETPAGVHRLEKPGYADRRLLAVVDEERLRRILRRMLDEEEFLSSYGIRSLSRFHLDNPCVVRFGGEDHVIGYLPAEADTAMFGGNTNWRGPIWMPINLLIVGALLDLYRYYGNDFTVECPTGSGTRMTLFEVAREIARRLSSIFLRDGQKRRPVFGGTEKFQTDPHWRDYVLFYECFHGDNGAGIGASHQTGWTGGIGTLLALFGAVNGEAFLNAGCEGGRPARGDPIRLAGER